LFVVKQEDGSYRWVSISSTAYLDREREIVSTKALEQVAAEAPAGDLGELTFWHVPIPLGTCDTRVVDGLCLIESGTWADSEGAVKLREDVQRRPEFWGVSIEFVADPRQTEVNKAINGTIVKRVYNRIGLIGRSILPKSSSANPFTSISTKGGFEMDQKKENLLVEVLGEEIARPLIQQVDEINQKSAEATSVFKEEDENVASEQTTDASQQEEPVPDENEQILEVIKALGAKMQELDTTVKDLVDKQAPRIAQQADRASQSTETIIDEDEEKELKIKQQVPAVLDSMAHSIKARFGGNQ